MLTALFIAYFLRKWVFPACLASAFAMDENALDLKNNFAPIPWAQIDRVVFKAGKYRNVVGIKLKDINNYNGHQLPMRNRAVLKINQLLYGCDFCISALSLKDGPSQTYNSINDFFIRTRLSKAGWIV